MESRPNRAMNQGAPAATTMRSGCSGSMMRSEPRSDCPRRIASSTPAFWIVGLTASWCQSRNRRSATSSCGGRPSVTCRTDSTPDRVGVTENVAVQVRVRFQPQTVQHPVAVDHRPGRADDDSAEVVCGTAFEHDAVGAGVRALGVHSKHSGGLDVEDLREVHADRDLEHHLDDVGREVAQREGLAQSGPDPALPPGSAARRRRVPFRGARGPGWWRDTAHAPSPRAPRSAFRRCASTTTRAASCHRGRSRAAGPAPCRRRRGTRRTPTPR